MPTALPISYSAAVAAPRPIGSLRPVWFIIVWAITMLLIGAFATPQAETDPVDPLQMLMIF